MPSHGGREAETFTLLSFGSSCSQSKSNSEINLNHFWAQNKIFLSYNYNYLFKTVLHIVVSSNDTSQHLSPLLGHTCMKPPPIHQFSFRISIMWCQVSHTEASREECLFSIPKIAKPTIHIGASTWSHCNRKAHLGEILHKTGGWSSTNEVLL